MNKELERILVIAETSESVDAMVLAAEVRRLRAFKDKMNEALEMRRGQRLHVVAERQLAWDTDRDMAASHLDAYLTRLDVEIPLLENLIEGE